LGKHPQSLYGLQTDHDVNLSLGDCLFCQNTSHKLVRTAPVLDGDELAKRARDPDVRCICFFGGSPEPQFPFALRAARRILRECGTTKHICWEWNGAGNPRLSEIAAETVARHRRGFPADGRWDPLYVGKTENFRTRIPSHKRWDEARRLGATHVHALVVPLETHRARLKAALIDLLKPPMNRDST
jgi:hypothetical protein